MESLWQTVKSLVIKGSAVSMIVCSTFAQTPNQQTKSVRSNSVSDVRRVISEANARWSEGWAKGDATMVAAIFANEGVQLGSNGKIFKGQQQIAEHQRTVMQSVDPGVKVTVITVNLWLDGDVAYETGTYKYEYTEKGKPGMDEGRYVTVWKRQVDGSWKLAMDMGVPQK
jgi:uncharacterized protein (TIGR02246 family)